MSCLRPLLSRYIGKSWVQQTIVFTTQHTVIQNLITRNAGHSHWKNIRHTKGLKDKLKGQLIAKVGMKVRIAVKENGSSDPKLNSSLAKIVTFAEQNDVPYKTIQQLIKNAESAKDTTLRTVVEARGPAGSFFIFDLLTDDLRKTKQQLHLHLSKHCGGSVLGSGATTAYFSPKGFIYASVKKGVDVPLAQAEDTAISVEAEEVHEYLDEDSGSKHYQFVCDPVNLHAVTKRLESVGTFDVISSTAGFIPTVYVQLSEKDKTNIEKAYDLIREMDIASIEEVYDNIKQ